jgi:hypothetical protein
MIIHCCHHKSGTVLMKNIHKMISTNLNLKFQDCKQKDLDKTTQVWLQHHSLVDFNLIKQPYLMSHMVRDFREIIISGFAYHKKCNELHVIHPGFIKRRKNKILNKIKSIEELNFLLESEWSNMSYQEILNNIDEQTGITFEMCIKAVKINNVMSNWNYNRPNCLELKFEDFMNDFDIQLRKLFRFYEIDTDKHEELIYHANKVNPINWNQEKVDNHKHVNVQSIIEKNGKKVFRTDKWKDYFTDRHKQLFKERYNDLLIKLGYEKDDNW